MSKVTLVHFCDAYHIEESKNDPGAPRVITVLKKMREDGINPLIVHSGDIFSPSLMSAVFRGKQMNAMLNLIGPKVGCVGNHDFDFGVPELTKLISNSSTTWLLSNVVDKASGNCLAGSKDKLIVEHDGVKVGFIGLVEEEWITTLAFDTSTIAYKDFVSEGNRLAAELRADGAQIVVVLSHMRVPNDEKLAQEVKGVDVILGGHDHFPHANAAAPTPLFKSGTDFRWLSKVAVNLPTEGNTANTKAKIDYELITVPRDVAPDVDGTALVDKFAADMQSKLGKVLAHCNTVLDARAATCRTEESNVGSFICDVMRREYDADCCLLNGGTIRSDATYGPGPFTIRDMLNILPFEDVCVVIRLSGKDILSALENGVSQLPKQEGRFPQVSGVHFTFDVSRPAGSRILSATIRGKQLNPDQQYTLATKPYLTEGKDGYDSLAGHPWVVDVEHGVMITTLIRNYFKKLAVVEKWQMATPILRAVKKMTHKSNETKPGDAVSFGPETDGRISSVSPSN